MDENGKFKDAKIKSLIRLFRPDRQGVLSRLDFAKSIDTVYKQLRLLRASIGNSGETKHLPPSSLCAKADLDEMSLLFFQRKSILPLRKSSIVFSTSSWLFALYQF